LDDPDLKRTPLEPEHVALGAKMGKFAGWSMPIEYAGTLTEHRAVRESVGIFDLTHLGKIEVAGPRALQRLQWVLSNDISRIDLGMAQYNLVLNESGGIVDDLIVYRDEEEGYVVVPNAANTGKVLAILNAEAGAGVVVAHRPDLVTIAVQGPASAELVGFVFPSAGALAYMHCSRATYRDQVALVSRSGYTGEVGFELFVPDEVASALWRELVEAGGALGLQPCGLGARDTLRLEMGYPLHGNDISEERTALEAGLGWAVAFDKGDFIGRDALLRQKEEGIPGRLWGLRMAGKLIPRPHYSVFSGEKRVGETTSGTFSPTLRLGIAMAYLTPRDGFAPGDAVEIDVRGRRGEAQVVRPPFVERSPK
jgi:aminomethyltransferase